MFKPRVSISYSFYIRVAPPNYVENGEKKVVPPSDEFRFVKLGVEYIEESPFIQASLEVCDGSEKELFKNSKKVEIKDPSLILKIPEQDFQEATEYLATLPFPFNFQPKIKTGSKASGKSDIFAFVHSFTFHPH